jgi:hypothetical protein
MTVTLSLPPDIEQGLLAEAESRGLSLDALLEELIRQHAAASVQSSGSDGGGIMVKLDDGMWALRTGHPISVDTVSDTIDALRRERDLSNLGLFH